MFTLDPSVPAEVGPFSWLIGVWEGTGVIDYTVASADGDDLVYAAEFRQRVSFSHDGLPFLNYSSTAWIIGADAADAADAAVPDADAGDPAAPAPLPILTPAPYVTETGYWRLRRALVDGDHGPGMLPGIGTRTFTTIDEVDTLRSPEGAFELEVSIVHPTGVSELYLGQVKGGRIDLGTDAVMRSSTAKEYTAATRLYGLVEGDLLWAWDIAAFGQELKSHASARLVRVE